MELKKDDSKHTKIFLDALETWSWDKAEGSFSMNAD